MAAYFYTRNKQKQGPVSSSELKQLAATGRLQPTDQVMKEGTSKWVPAGSIKGLFPANTPAAPQPMSAPPPPMPESPEPARGGSRVLLWLFLLVVLGGLGAGGVMFMGKGGDGDGKSSDKDSGGKQAGKDGGGKGAGGGEVVDDDPGSDKNRKRKIEAWRAFVDAFAMNFEDEATRKEHLEKCDKLLDDYLKIPFDPLKFTEEAKEITKTYQRKNLQAQYPFWEPRKKLDANVQEIKTELLRGTDTK